MVLVTTIRVGYDYEYHESPKLSLVSGNLYARSGEQPRLGYTRDAVQGLRSALNRPVKATSIVPLFVAIVAQCASELVCMQEAVRMTIGAGADWRLAY